MKYSDYFSQRVVSVIAPIALAVMAAPIVLSACQSEVGSVNPESVPETVGNLPVLEHVIKDASGNGDINVAASAIQRSLNESSKTEITVYKSPTCGCCQDWVTYLEEEGFKVTAIDRDDVNTIKTQLGLVDDSLKSCHTAIVDGYLVEGHVPANDIKRLLAEKPASIKGLSAPGMPMMSPGMASRTPRDYAVLSFTETGETAVYSQY